MVGLAWVSHGNRPISKSWIVHYIFCYIFEIHPTQGIYLLVWLGIRGGLLS